jgi:hypothetical protein
MNKITLAGMSALGLNLNTEIEGSVVAAAKQTTRKNVFALELTDAEGKSKRTAFVGAKSIDEGLLVQADEKSPITIAPGFELYQNQQNETWIRNKERANAKIEVIA